jgi:protease I
MSNTLRGQKIAILATDGFEQSELEKPLDALKNEDATVYVISPKSGSIKGWEKNDWGNNVDVDIELKDAEPADYDALVLPGGQMNPDKLRIIPEALEFIRHFVEENKPIAAICHGPWPLIEVDGVSGKRMTSWASLKTDLTNAGAIWLDQSVVKDTNLVTSRKPEDLAAFNKEIIQMFAEYKASPTPKKPGL